MEQNEKTAQGLSIGPALEKLLYALRALASTRDYYHDALEELIGEDDAAKVWDVRDAKAFDALAEKIEVEIMEILRDWAYRTTPTNVI